MRRIVKGRSYDTEEAEEIAFSVDGTKRDYFYSEETLFRRADGEYFIYGYGHADSKYAQTVAGNFCPGSAIRPLSLDEAREWAERSLPPHECEAIFGEADDGAGGVELPVRVKASTRDALGRMAAEYGLTVGELIDDMAEAAL